MTTTEFSNEFDTLINSYNIELYGSLQNPLNFDEYEKSVFLTLALEELVIDCYSGNAYKNAFETSEDVRRYLDLLVITNCPNRVEFPNSLSDSFKHTIFALPENIWFIIYEQATYGEGNSCINGFAAEVVPTTHDSFYRVKGNPFRGPSRKRVLRLDSGLNTVELVSKYLISNYEIRYIKRPSPIILTPLEGDMKINGESRVLTCALNTALHRQILERAVQLALSSRVPQGTNK